MMTIETRIHTAQCDEGAYEQRRTNKQHDRQGNLAEVLSDRLLLWLVPDPAAGTSLRDWFRDGP